MEIPKINQQLVKDETGNIYGNWLVLERASVPEKYIKHKTKHHGAFWLCECQCEYKTQTIQHGRTLRQGSSKGCLECRNDKFRENKTIESAYNAVLYKFKQSALKRSIPFELTLENVKHFITQDCFYCGTSPSNIDARLVKLHNFYYSGIDRVDNTLGYSPENCVPCCKICNTAKSTLSQEEFFVWIKRVMTHSKL